MGEVHDLFPGLKVDEGSNKARAERCMSRIIEVLEEENCNIVPDFRLSGMTMSVGITVVAKPYGVPETSLN